jgi:hypothetical protein
VFTKFKRTNKDEEKLGTREGEERRREAETKVSVICPLPPPPLPTHSSISITHDLDFSMVVQEKGKSGRV